MSSPSRVRSGTPRATTTLDTYSHLWPTAEDRSRDPATTLMAGVKNSVDLFAAQIVRSRSREHQASSA
jgi:hypothetical protein